MSTRVLIVDDSPILRLSMRRAVTQAGVEDDDILEAENGQAALDLLGSESVDLVLLDLHMPVLDGESVVKALASSGEIAKQMVVVVSTEANQDRLAGLYELGIRGYLHKPFEPEELRDLTGDLFGKAS